MTETTPSDSSMLDAFRQLWKQLSTGQRVALVFAVVAILSPFLPWFSSCTNPPGQYSCERWNGFQKDNDIFGLIVFLTGALLLYSVLWSLIVERWQLIFRPGELQISFGIFLVVLSILRVITFAGKSTDVTTIGPSSGLLLLFLSGLGVIIGNQLPTILAMQENWNKLPDSRNSSHDRQSHQPEVEDEEELSDQDRELHSLLQDDTNDERDKS